MRRPLPALALAFGIASPALAQQAMPGQPATWQTFQTDEVCFAIHANPKHQLMLMRGGGEWAAALVTESGIQNGVEINGGLMTTDTRPVRWKAERAEDGNTVFSFPVTEADIDRMAAAQYVALKDDTGYAFAVTEPPTGSVAAVKAWLAGCG